MCIVSQHNLELLLGYVKLNEMGICELGSDVEDELLPVDSNVPEERDKIRKHNASITQSQALLHYFAKLARSDDIDEEIDMAFVDGLIKSGINETVFFLTWFFHIQCFVFFARHVKIQFYKYYESKVDMFLVFLLFWV